ncbi:hypothetical protein E2C01_016970 [Portunus trituberculatus]|uniref:Uncharacterized protein n=1 Tax=Portunus trituberculatus TaxID=210409 RepID=A0A5B7DS57_PORTR|nr:hypothetical protein [Portunus trituberculatus]
MCETTRSSSSLGTWRKARRKMMASFLQRQFRVSFRIQECESVAHSPGKSPSARRHTCSAVTVQDQANAQLQGSGTELCNDPKHSP